MTVDSRWKSLRRPRSRSRIEAIRIGRFCSGGRGRSIGPASALSTGIGRLGVYRAAYPQARRILRELLEPVPVHRSLRSNPNFEDSFRVPEFTVMKWQKAEAL